MPELGSNNDPYKHNSESKRPDLDEIRDSIDKYHQLFLEKVPRYSKGAWNPAEAVKLGEGSCMAELLYVAGGLLYSGACQEADLTIGFRVDHGTKIEGRFGKAITDYAHTTLFISYSEGMLETDFRANRADERPRLQAFDGDFLANTDRYYIGTLTDATKRYAEAISQSPMTVGDLVKLHDGIDYKSEASDVRFDKEF